MANTNMPTKRQDIGDLENRGRRAYQMGVSRDMCVFARDSDAYKAFVRGWDIEENIALSSITLGERL